MPRLKPTTVDLFPAVGPKVAVVSLRNALWWHPRPVACIQDAFFSLISKWADESKARLGFYNVSWTADKPKRERNALAQADWVFLMTNQEFVYHSRHYNAPLFTKNSDALAARDAPLLKGKHLVVFSMDALDDEKLLHEKVLKGVKLGSFHMIDECSFPGSVQSCRVNQLRSLFDYDAIRKRTRQYDFVYWGTTKRALPGDKDSGDLRFAWLKNLLPDPELKTWLIGKDFGKAKATGKFDPNMTHLVSHLIQGRATCCFQWPGHPARLTARYHEAVACGIVPFCHIDYATTYGGLIADWQRVATVEELKEKVIACRDRKWYVDWLLEVNARYKNVVPSDDVQYTTLARRLENIGLAP